MPARDKEELDKEWIELLNELRVVLPGVQVLFAFLLAAPFSQRFGGVTDVQENAYFFSLLFTTKAIEMKVTTLSSHSDAHPALGPVIADWAPIQKEGLKSRPSQ